MKYCFVCALAMEAATVGCHAQVDKRIAVGEAPNSVEIADFSGDGKLDLVVANSGSNNVTILLGDGKGSFAEAKGSPFPAGHSPNDICVGDFNGDGSLDLAIANHEATYLTVLLGDGLGRFSRAPRSPVTVLSRPHPHGVATGDFDGDGKLDIVTESWRENKVIVVFGDGRGGFGGPGLKFAVGKRPYQRVRVADVNGDGIADIITTNLEGDNVTVLLGDGEGGFNQAAGSPFPCGKSPFSVAIGDLNGDGKPDFAIANWAGQSETKIGEGVTIMFGDGDGRFKSIAGSVFPTGGGPGRIAIGDVDGDGACDVAVTNYLSSSVTVLHGQSGSFGRPLNISVGTHPQGITLGDLNGDGKADIVVTNSDDNSISTLISGVRP